MRANNSKRLAVLSDLERWAFYGLPDFDDEQRTQYLTFDEQSWAVIDRCPSLATKVHCALLLGYFKAKHMFFRLSRKSIPHADLRYLLSRYFPDEDFDTCLATFHITPYEHYLQREAISVLLAYRMWSLDFLPMLEERSALSVKRDSTPAFIAHELLTFLQQEKIIRPGYTTLQDIISHALTEERQRLKACLGHHLTEAETQILKQLLAQEDTLSDLATLKQDAQSFKLTMMKQERLKHITLKPLYAIAKRVLPHLEISQQNIAHYASLVHYYTPYDLDLLDEAQTLLYLLCYSFKRYQLVNDNLVDALDYHCKRLDKEAEIKAQQDIILMKDKEIGQLLLLYVDESVSDAEVRQKAFAILPKEVIRSMGQHMIHKNKRKQEQQWQERDKLIAQYTQHLRPLLLAVDWASTLPDNPLLKAVQWLKERWTHSQRLSRQSFENFPQDFISQRLKPYIVTTDDKQRPCIRVNRYEILVYRQLIQQMATGTMHIEDSIRHRTFAHELVAIKDKGPILEKLSLPWRQTPCATQCDTLLQELDTLWVEFNTALKDDTLKNFKYKKDKEELLWLRPRNENLHDNPKKSTLYDALPLCDIADVLRFVHDKTQCLDAFTPLQPRYRKQDRDNDHVIASIMAQALNIGHHKMAQTSDITYRTLESTYHQYVRLSTLNKACDCIIEAIANLDIFKHYNFDLDLLYGSLDGQKFETLTPTAKARYSRKYYKKGRGVVAYTLLSNHVPLATELIGAHEHESYFAFDIWYGNTSVIQPTVITGDMHAINKANFAIFHWFGADFRPRFSNMKKELKRVACSADLNHEDFLVKPVGKIDRELILSEQENIDRIIATLALKEMSQSTLIRKLCALSPNNRTRQAVFEFDKMIRSIYTLRCALDPDILGHSHYSQNRIESYHSLRGAISRASGRKALLGKTDIEVAVSNQCGRMIACSVIYYNGEIQSRLWERTPPHNKRKRKVIRKASPVAWHHLHFTGHFTFYDNAKKIDIDALIARILL